MEVDKLEKELQRILMDSHFIQTKERMTQWRLRMAKATVVQLREIWQEKEIFWMQLCQKHSRVAEALRLENNELSQEILGKISGKRVGCWIASG